MGLFNPEDGPLHFEGSAQAQSVVGSAGDILKVPIRKLRSRKNEGLRKFIVPLYEKPVLKFLAWAEPHAPLATLIFGYPFGLDAQGKADHGATGFSVEQESQLRELWEELRVDILAARRLNCSRAVTAIQRCLLSAARSIPQSVRSRHNVTGH